LWMANFHPDVQSFSFHNGSLIMDAPE
jgi:hypothetical protein